MNRRLLVFIGVALAVVAGAVLAWRLASPLPLDTTVDQALPTEPPQEERPTAQPQVPHTPQSTPSLDPVDLDHQALMDQVLYGSDGAEGQRLALNQIAGSGDTRFVAALIDTLRYQPALRAPIGDALIALTGQDLPPDWFAWVEWAGQHPEIESFAAYPAWKAELYAHIDPGFGRFLYDGVKVAPGSRVEEIVWGGVVVDGIPALDTPTMVDPVGADYLVAEERVFGLSVNGDTRAYPARFLDWHEMFNDVVGGEPVSLAY
jgi:hypothetical protein